MKTTNYVLLVIALIIIAGCAQQTQQLPAQTPPAAQQAAPTVAAKAPAATEAAALTNDVAIKNFAFTPRELAVKKGTTVTWTNEDSTPHIIAFSDSESQQLGKGDTYSKKFDTVGTFEYHCSIHPSMQGTIVVE